MRGDAGTKILRCRAGFVSNELEVSGGFSRQLLEEVAGWLAAGRRLTEQQALALFSTADLHGLSWLVDQVRAERAHLRAGWVTYVVNRVVHYTNCCALGCPICAFWRPPEAPDAYTLTIDEILERARSALAVGATELHIVGGVHPRLPFGFYLELLRALKGLDRRLHLKCFTAVEVLHFASLTGQAVGWVLERLREAGLDSLAGGGAEIFAPAVRRRVAPRKPTADEYLEVHRTWHLMGGRSTCTMLYGHVESVADRVEHLSRLRRLQDETGGFCAFVPLPFRPGAASALAVRGPTGVDSLRTIAVARLYLDNIEHITAYWVGLGVKLAQLALLYGADDLNGTVMEERVFASAGAAGQSPRYLSEAELVRLIAEAGFCPVRRDSVYNPVKVWTWAEVSGLLAGGFNVSGEAGSQVKLVSGSGVKCREDSP